VQPRTEQGAARRFRHWCDHPSSAGRATHREPVVLRHGRCDLGQLDLLAGADDLRRKCGVQAAAAARVSLGTVLNERTGPVHNARLWPS